MSLKALSDPDAFWQFACELYAKNEVKHLCLYSQDELGLNVNLILFCAWLFRFNKHLNASQWQAIKQAIASSETELGELRQKRNSFDKGTDPYKHCLKRELLLEALQQKQVLGAIQGKELPDATEHPLLGYFRLMQCSDTITRDKLLSLFNRKVLHDQKDVYH